MSLLLNQPSKLCFRKPVLVRSSPLLSNNGFSTSLPHDSPCVIICADPCRPELGKVVISSAKGCTPYEEKVPKELRREVGKIGSSNGWLATLKDDVVRLRFIDLYPVASEPDPIHISLPPLVTLPHCQTKIVTNLVVSSSSPEDEDCVVAVKFLGPQISFCRPAQSNSEWINIRIENPCFFSSHVMFSKKDDMFRIVGCGGHLIGSWNLHKHMKNPKLQSLRFQNLPKLTKTKRDLLDSCCTSEHLVESKTTGETFLVKWYKKTTGKIIKGISKLKTEALMVFKLDEEGNAIYTQDIGEDIGDQSIFLTKSEPFSVPCTSFLCLRQPKVVRILDVDESKTIKLTDQKWNCSRQRHPRSWEYITSWCWV
ncbi:uncharacterized protein LOC110229551 [Arabidopsis lyrata subsp. lyrata]|uniref:uncharacterized protein LOC110229551 n=1 Tax=Arabidopsis lyrata subsp. lyrata TaxID=81972 RepID=UPI000A29CB90|nr:uncharacterized protein LOC110229551 [Arabidopsis lyrata subsp. lyrata]|eukprot:XP_020885754.1 uncharacterized protein LOC110229551 [Arabidopsis lyrata subsp. lyrata]